ncbi:MAG: hypothetical protein KDA71_12100 [Planctomycetales bacterium]|nr:hypothetical protein [Planctomycetales bacterium]
MMNRGGIHLAKLIAMLAIALIGRTVAAQPELDEPRRRHEQELAELGRVIDRLRGELGEAERAVKEAASEIARPKPSPPSDEQTDRQRARLRRALDRLFDLRTELQATELRREHQRLAAIEHELEQQRRHRGEMFERQFRELARLPEPHAGHRPEPTGPPIMIRCIVFEASGEIAQQLKQAGSMPAESDQPWPDLSEDFARQLREQLEQKQVKILSEPTIMTLPHQQAMFHVGGETPVAGRSRDGDEPLGFLPFGTRAEFTPKDVRELQGRPTLLLEASLSLSEPPKQTDASDRESPPVVHERTVRTLVEFSARRPSIVIGPLPRTSEYSSSTYVFIAARPVDERELKKR